MIYEKKNKPNDNIFTISQKQQLATESIQRPGIR